MVVRRYESLPNVNRKPLQEATSGTLEKSMLATGNDKKQGQILTHKSSHPGASR